MRPTPLQWICSGSLLDLCLMGPHVSIQSHNKTKSTYREQLSIVKWLLASSLCPQYPRTSRIYHHFPRTIYTSAMTIRDLDQLHVGRSHKNWTPKILQILHNRNNKWSCSAFIQNKSFQIRNIPQAVYFFPSIAQHRVDSISIQNSRRLYISRLHPPPLPNGQFSHSFPQPRADEYKTAIGPMI